MAPLLDSNTVTGFLKLSTPEATTAFDLAGYYRHCGWLDNIAMVLSELVEVIDPEKLVTAAELSADNLGAAAGLFIGNRWN